VHQPDGIRFLHVPRTGGTTIKTAWRLREPEYRGHSLPDGERFLYGFSRDPWDRVVSVYHLLHPNEPEEGRVSFRDWLVGDAGDRVPQHDGVPIHAPCATWLRGAQFVGRFEDRRDVELLARMLGRPVPSQHHGARESQSGHRGHPRRHYSGYYDERSERLVRELFAEDIERYGYTFQYVAEPELVGAS
jgi:hypothetical protein